MAVGAFGVVIFYVEYQYEDVYWGQHEKRDYTAAALPCSSFSKLPRIPQWFTGNIGFHHIPHLSPRIPNCNLEACHNSHEIFHSVKPITILSSLRTMRLRPWDEENRRLIGFRELQQSGMQPA